MVPGRVFELASIIIGFALMVAIPAWAWWSVRRERYVREG